MLNIDPLLFQPKVIRLSTTSNIGLPGQHIIRTTEYSNSQVMTGTTAHAHNEANNNILTTNNARITDGYPSVRRPFGREQTPRSNFNDMEQTDTDDMTSSGDQADWTVEQMFWSGEGECSDSSMLERLAHQNSASIMSFQSNLSNSSASTSFHSQLSDQSESKEEMISALLNKVKTHNKVEASKILLAMSNTVENCIAMRQCGCLPLLVELLHCSEETCNVSFQHPASRRQGFEVRERAALALRNVVLAAQADRREARVLKLLEQVRDYVDTLRCDDDNRNARIGDQHLGPAVAALMKLSFDEGHRHAMCQLGGLQALAELLVADQEAQGCSSATYCVAVRRYAGMALTNLTFGDSTNKALLCAMRPFMEALVAQLYSPSEDLRQVTASVLRNLSWRADPSSKRALRDVGAVPLLVQAAMQAEKESTLRSILSALWNLSAHCSANKADICRIEGALAFLVSTLTYRSKAKTLAIVENGGGILRNVSSHVAIQNDYRQILRRHNCLQILLHHLKSPSLTVVSNACGTLWNLSARNATDQRALWEMGAVGMLKKLIHSKHKMISMGSSAALKNLLSAQPPGLGLGLCDGYRTNDDQPSLSVRKQKALSAELDQNLSETYDNTDSPKTSPVKTASQQQQRSVRRHASPSAARYLANQRLKNELSLVPQRPPETGVVVEEKHNGAFQVTKNAKQGFIRPPEHQEMKQHHQQQGIPSPRHRVASSRSMSPMGVKKEARGPSRPGRIPEPVQKVLQVQEAAKPHESRIPLPKSSTKLDPQRSQSASPVAQRRIPQPSQQQRDINVTHPKYAWNHPSSPEKQDNDPEKPVSFSKRLGGQDYPTTCGILKLQEDSSEDEVKVYRTEHTPSNYSLNSSLNDLEESGGGGGTRCSLNIRTSTNVRMIKNHPLLANRCDDNGRLFESRHPHHREDNGQDYDGAGRTVEFSVQSEYDIEEELSMLSRSSSVASVSDCSHPTSGIESPSELSECQTAPTSPHSSSNYISAVCGDTSEQVLTTMVTAADTFGSPKGEVLTIADDVSHSLDPTLRAESSSSLESADDEDISPADRLMLEEVIQAGKPQAKGGQLEVPAAEYESHSENEEKGKEDERRAEKNRLFRIPEDPREQKGNRRCLRVKAAGEPVPVQMEFLMRQESEEVVGQDVQSEFQNLPSGVEPQAVLTKLQSESPTRQSRGQSEFQDVQSEVELESQPAQSRLQSEFEDVQSRVQSKSGGDIAVRGKTEKVPSQLEFLMKPTSRDEVAESSAEPPSKKENVPDQLFKKQTSRNEIKESSTVSKKANVPSQLEFLMKSPSSDKVADSSSSHASQSSKKEKVPSQLEFLMKSPSTDKVAESSANHATQSRTNGNVPSQLEFLMKPVGDNQVTDLPTEPPGKKEIKPDSREDAHTVPSVEVHQDENDEVTATSAILDEARDIARALMGARADSTEDMTVSTLSCLSDIDSARPPSAMAELGCLSMTGSLEGGRLPKHVKKSLLRELQLGRLGGDSNESSRASDLIGNVGPPSAFDDMTASTGSLEGSDDSDCCSFSGRFAAVRGSNDSGSERMHDAAAMANVYARELTNITGRQDDTFKPEQDRHDGSDTELEDDLPCDDDDEEDDDPTTRDPNNHHHFMTSEELEALRENADMVLNTLRDVEISDEEEEHCGNSNGDLLEDETMSLVSGSSEDEDDDLLPPAARTCGGGSNGMVGLPLTSPKTTFPSKSPVVQQTIDTRTFTRKKGGIPRGENVPCVQRGQLRSPSAAPPAFPQGGGKQVESRIAGVWKNGGKARSKSADVGRKMKMAACGGQLSYEDDKSSQRSSSQSSSPKSPLSRSNTFEKLVDEPQIRRPSSLALAQSPRRTPPQRVQPAQSPGSSQIPKPRSSLIPARRSMIPKPGSFGGQRDN